MGVATGMRRVLADKAFRYSCHAFQIYPTPRTTQAGAPLPQGAAVPDPLRSACSGAGSSCEASSRCDGRPRRSGATPRPGPGLPCSGQPAGPLVVCLGDRGGCGRFSLGSDLRGSARIPWCARVHSPRGTNRPGRPQVQTILTGPGKVPSHRRSTAGLSDPTNKNPSNPEGLEGLRESALTL